MNYAAGTIVKAREREWVVLPESSAEVLKVRPLGGSLTETTAILSALEPVEEASFTPPGPSDLGDYRSAQLLRDATVLGSRNSAAAIRCFSRINVEPRSYQLVPLLMALKSAEERVRLLVADGVGVGKTIEALLIARELWDRGEVERLAVLCPPALAEQWHREMVAKFQFDAVLVLSSTASRLEREAHAGESLFERYPVTVVSLDYIKSERRRQEFLRTAPELIIVDEAHTCVTGGRGQSHMRHEVVGALAQDNERHMIFTTATPHSGNQEAFDTLIGLLNPRLKDARGTVTDETIRKRLAQHFVQRRREDIKHFLEEDTRFPAREELESTYKLSPQYKKLFDAALSYARRSVGETERGTRDHRVRWWSALALLRALGSSPAAAAATLRNRAATVAADSAEAADEIGRRFVLDHESGEDSEVLDTVAGSDYTEEAEDGPANKERRKLLELAREAEKITLKTDTKLQGALELTARLVKDGFNPILFCRYIATAEYLGTALKERFKDLEVSVVTGELPPAEREARIHGLDTESRRVLVATDCLSEGINLQEFFDAVVHYDLSWNPTRHEQREGRVDRYGQRKEEVRAVTLYGSNNPVDGLVLEVLIRKHKAIRSELGISIPVPVDTNDVLDALLEGLILRSDWKGTDGGEQLLLEGFEEDLVPKRNALHGEWEQAKERERKRLHSRYAQQGIDTSEVAAQLQEVRRTAGDRASVRRLVENAVQIYGGTTQSDGDETLSVTTGNLPGRLRFILSPEERAEARFSFNGPRTGHTELFRTHRTVQELASYLMDTSLEGAGKARRAGVIRSSTVTRRTALLLLRGRFRLIQKAARKPATEEIVEETMVRAFQRNEDGTLHWIGEDEALALFDLLPEADVPNDLAGRTIAGLAELYLEHQHEVADIVSREAERLQEHHQAIRGALDRSRATVELRPQLPVDLLGLYAVLPGGRA